MTTYTNHDPITVDLRQVAKGLREAYDNASTTEARVAIHHSAARIADKVWGWETPAAQQTLYRRWMELCFGAHADAQAVTS